MGVKIKHKGSDLYQWVGDDMIDFRCFEGFINNLNLGAIELPVSVWSCRNVKHYLTFQLSQQYVQDVYMSFDKDY